MITETTNTELQYRALKDIREVAEAYGIPVDKVTVEHMHEFNHIDTTAATGCW
jgi:diphthamide synthase subunit DPH2